MDDMHVQNQLHTSTLFFDTISQESNFPGIPSSHIQVSIIPWYARIPLLCNCTSSGSLFFELGDEKCSILVVLQRGS